MGHGIAATPPPEVHQALDRVQRVAQELQSRGLTARFGLGSDEKMTLQVVDAGGSVVREVPAVQGLDLLAGEAASGASLA